MNNKQLIPQSGNFLTLFLLAYSFSGKNERAKRHYSLGGLSSND
jgi:hypothetical protein